jgi:hypothetical protein
VKCFFDNVSDLRGGQSLANRIGSQIFKLIGDEIVKTSRINIVVVIALMLYKGISRQCYSVLDPVTHLFLAKQHHVF